MLVLQINEEELDQPAVLLLFIAFRFLLFQFEGYFLG